MSSKRCSRFVLMDVNGELPEYTAAPLAISTRRLPPSRPRHSGSVWMSTYLHSLVAA